MGQLKTHEQSKHTMKIFSVILATAAALRSRTHAYEDDINDDFAGEEWGKCIDVDPCVDIWENAEQYTDEDELDAALDQCYDDGDAECEANTEEVCEWWECLAENYGSEDGSDDELEIDDLADYAADYAEEIVYEAAEAGYVEGLVDAVVFVCDEDTECIEDVLEEADEEFGSSDSGSDSGSASGSDSGSDDEDVGD